MDHKNSTRSGQSPAKEEEKGEEDKKKEKEDIEEKCGSTVKTHLSLLLMSEANGLKATSILLLQDIKQSLSHPLISLSIFTTEIGESVCAEGK